MHFQFVEYMHTISKKNKDGSKVDYIQLAHIARDPQTDYLWYADEFMDLENGEHPVQLQTCTPARENHCVPTTSHLKQIE